MNLETYKTERLNSIESTGDSSQHRRLVEMFLATPALSQQFEGILHVQVGLSQGYLHVFFLKLSRLKLNMYLSGNPTHDSIRGYYGSIKNFPSSLGVLLCELRPDIDTLLCSIGLQCVHKKNLLVSAKFLRKYTPKN